MAESQEAVRWRAIIYGSIATPVTDEERGDTENTHKWSVYVRGFHDEDISAYVRRVVFKLHESFPNAARAIDTPPFEVHEMGWGEFTVQIRVFFQDPLQKPLLLSHQLRLYPFDRITGLALPMDGDSPPPPTAVVSEEYEEIVFDPATERMAAILDADDQASYTHLKTSPRYEAFAVQESEEMQRIDAAIAQVRAQIDEASAAPIVAQDDPNPTTMPVHAQESRKSRSRR